MFVVALGVLLSLLVALNVGSGANGSPAADTREGSGFGLGGPVVRKGAVQDGVGFRPWADTVTPGPLGYEPERDAIDSGTSCLAGTPAPGATGLGAGRAASSPFAQFQRLAAVNKALDRSQAVFVTRLTAIFGGIDITPILDGLWETAKQAALILGGFTAAGAVAGAFAGGVGAVPGAVAGAGVGMLVLNLMGLEELISEIPQQIEAIVGPYRDGFKLAWAAPDTPDREAAAVEDAASEFAAGHVALSLAVLGAVIAYALRGKGKPLKEVLEKSRLKNAADWLEKNATRLKERMDARARGGGAQAPADAPSTPRPQPAPKPVPPVAERLKKPPRKRLPETDVPCFNPYRSKRFQRMNPAQQQAYLENYAKQLRRQQEAINSMTADEFGQARNAFNTVGRGATAKAAQKDARADFEGILKENIHDSLLAQVPDGAPVDQEKLVDAAEKRAKEIMKGLDAVHNPDMVAGGSAIPAEMGNRNVNRAIGGSWPHRIDGLDNAAKGAVARGDGDALMNVKLEVCRGRLP